MKDTATKLTSEYLTSVFTLMGLNSLTAAINQFDQGFVEKTIIRRMEQNQINLAENYVTFLANDEAERNALRDALYIGYTEFFRNALTFATL